MIETKRKEVFVTYINLDRSIDRRRSIEKLLARAQLPALRSSATDGGSFDFETDDLHNSLSMAERGCAHSHREVWKRFLTESSAPFALVMEDDIEFNSDFSWVVNEVLRQAFISEKLYVQFDYAPVGIKGVLLWWFLLLNRARNQKGRVSFWMLLPYLILKGIAANLLALYEGMRDAYYRRTKKVSLARARKDRYLAGCYLLSRRAATELLHLNTPLREAADAVHNIARRQGRIDHYLCIPRSTRQKRETFTSTLDNSHFGKKIIAY